MVMEELGDLFELVACCFSESREVRVLGWFLQNVENVCGGRDGVNRSCNLLGVFHSSEKYFNLLRKRQI